MASSQVSIRCYSILHTIQIQSAETTRPNRRNQNKTWYEKEVYILSSSNESLGAWQAMQTINEVFLRWLAASYATQCMCSLISKANSVYCRAKAENSPYENAQKEVCHQGLWTWIKILNWLLWSAQQRQWTTDQRSESLSQAKALHKSSKKCKESIEKDRQDSNIESYYLPIANEILWAHDGGYAVQYYKDSQEGRAKGGRLGERGERAITRVGFAWWCTPVKISYRSSCSGCIRRGQIESTHTGCGGRRR